MNRAYTAARAALVRFTKDESGASMIEYALLAGLISIAAIAAVGFIGDELVEAFTAVQSALQAR
ncbi:MAG TPA: Flp family type IVb pilin [Caulobacteraceae bacterium]|nr:Flp family type IVb pilin [Caulobacteraceae bacterium]